jgi:AbrB family looped-hinge helix DNA binding protein
MAYVATMSSKGQLVIPADLRKEMGLKPGSRVVLRRHGRALQIEPNSSEAVMALCGKYASYPLAEILASARRMDEKKLEARNENLRP